MSFSQARRSVTSMVEVYVFGCEAGCSAELVIPYLYPMNHPSESTAFRNAGWLEVLSNSAMAGPIFCSWDCLALYASNPAVRRTSEVPMEQP